MTPELKITYYMDCIKYMVCSWQRQRREIIQTKILTVKWEILTINFLDHQILDAFRCPMGENLMTAKIFYRHNFCQSRTYHTFL